MTQTHSPREAHEVVFVTSDGMELYYRYWPALAEETEKKAIILFHRGHEHSGRLQHIVDELDLPEMAMFAWDARGHGLSPGERGYCPSIGRSVQDVDEFVRLIVTKHHIPYENIIVIGQSVGAVFAATWVHDYAPKIRGLILASPAFKVKLYVPFARTGIKLWQKIKGKVFYINSYVKAGFLTHDTERIQSFKKDRLITRAIASNVLLDLYETSERIVADAAAITIPTQLLISGDDFVVHHKPQHLFYQRLRSPIKEQHIFSGFYHDTLGEQDRHLVFEKIDFFIDTLFARPPQVFDYTQEDRWSPSADTYRQLSADLPKFSLKSFFYRCFRFGLKHIGKDAQGIKLGLETGFDSGSTLDYVYQNEAQGKNLLGKFMDEQYLKSPGWTGIRQRKIHLEFFIKKTIGLLNENGKTIHIVDIAAGHGRYVLDAVQDDPRIESILFRDYSDLNVKLGSEMIAARNLQERAQFIHGNAFDTEDLAHIHPKPSLAIVSGLYELFGDNTLVNASLAGLAQALEEGGYLIYTNQPWHPQQELIARGLTSHRDGQPWVMRVRSQAEMDDLVAKAGFEKQDELIDQWGIFTVSLAKRTGK